MRSTFSSSESCLSSASTRASTEGVEADGAWAAAGNQEIRSRVVRNFNLRIMADLSRTFISLYIQTAQLMRYVFVTGGDARWTGAPPTPARSQFREHISNGPRFDPAEHAPLSRPFFAGVA